MVNELAWLSSILSPLSYLVNKQDASQKYWIISKGSIVCTPGRGWLWTSSMLNVNTPGFLSHHLCKLVIFDRYCGSHLLMCNNKTQAWEHSSLLFYPRSNMLVFYLCLMFANFFHSFNTMQRLNTGLSITSVVLFEEWKESESLNWLTQTFLTLQLYLYWEWSSN
jgi:hypothetical protein